MSNRGLTRLDPLDELLPGEVLGKLDALQSEKVVGVEVRRLPFEPTPQLLHLLFASNGDVLEGEPVIRVPRPFLEGIEPIRSVRQRYHTTYLVNTVAAQAVAEETGTRAETVVMSQDYLNSVIRDSMEDLIGQIGEEEARQLLQEAANESSSDDQDNSKNR